LAYTTLDGLLAVFLYNIFILLKHETTSNIGILGNYQKVRVGNIMLPEILD